MSKRVSCWVGVMVMATCAIAQAEWTGAPVAGVDLGVAIPVSKFRRAADVGGMIGPFAGYQIGSGVYAFTPLIQMQYAGFPNNDDDHGGVLTDLFAIGGGGRFSLFDDHAEFYLQATLSYYKNFNGPLRNEDGEGFAVMGGYNYEPSFLPPGMALGVFIRRDEADIDAAADRDDALQYLVTGFSLRQRFLPPAEVPPAPVVAAAPAPTPPVSKKIVLRGVNFDFDKSNLRKDAIPILDEAARTLGAESTLQVSVEGHTDSRGTDAYNQALSLRRANTVRDYLSGHGVDKSRMSVVGHGESKPVASNDTDDGRAQNRRVELLVK